MFNLGDDTIGLAEKTKKRLQYCIEFYKKWCEFVRSSFFHLLTLIHLIDDRSGWIAFQLQNSLQSRTLLIFVYRLLDGLSSRSFQLMDIDVTQIFSVTSIDASDSPKLVSGHDLHFHGLTVDLSQPNSATIIILRATKS
jgi:hypothetical protein